MTYPIHSDNHKTNILTIQVNDDYLLVNDVNFSLAKTSPSFYIDLFKLKIENLLFQIMPSFGSFGIDNSNKAEHIITKGMRLRKKMLSVKMALHFRKCVNIIYKNIISGADEFHYVIGNSFNNDNEIITEALVRYFHNNDQTKSFLKVSPDKSYSTIGLWFKFKCLDF